MKILPKILKRNSTGADTKVETKKNEEAKGSVASETDAFTPSEGTEEAKPKTSGLAWAATGVLGATTATAAAMTVAHIAGAPGLAGKVAAAAALGGGLAVGWAASDVASGVAHHALDNYFTKDTPLLGKIVDSFQNHHNSPSMENGTFFENIAPPAAVGTVFGLATIGGVALMGAAAAPALAIAGAAGFGLSMALGGAFTQGSHRWSHMENPPKIAEVTQKLKLSIKPEEHDLHHSGTYEGDYALVNGWSNKWLNGALRKWETVIEKVTGARPASWDNPDVERWARGEIDKEEFAALRQEKIEKGEIVPPGGLLDDFPKLVQMRNDRHAAWDARRDAKKS